MKLPAANLMLGLSGNLSLSKDDRRNLAHPAVGGIILFARNFSDAEQLRQLAADIRRAAGRRILIAADQEGGGVQRFCGGGFLRLPSAQSLAAAETENAGLLRAAGMVMAAELIAAGVDLSFAPVLDLARGRSKIIGARAFAAEGEKAAAAALQCAEGMRAAGMASCGKHFPGHGYARADSHKTLPEDGREFSEIAAADLIPFIKWAAQKMPALMSAHIVYPKCDSAAATFSAFWLKKILRQKLKFRGMIIGDDLCMAGANIGGMKERMAAALAAGCEGLPVCLPDGAEEALSALSGVASEKNPWLSLSPKPDGAICIGDAEY
ncbi:MAG: beta-N-acetylhexosaminidase, partial [Betaproteobacteria bacterium]|nr:beta-N-acetylhexosaminidase [Betaproteobacteria bacterium]